MSGTWDNIDYSLLGDDHVRLYRESDGGDDYLIVASVGGSPKHPAWYLNLQADPKAQIQVKADVLDVVAHTATDDEKPRLWKIVNETWPNYEVYQTRTDRVIPVVVLSPTG